MYEVTLRSAVKMWLKAICWCDTKDGKSSDSAREMRKTGTCGVWHFGVFSC